MSTNEKRLHRQTCRGIQSVPTFSWMGHEALGICKSPVCTQYPVVRNRPLLEAPCTTVVVQLAACWKYGKSPVRPTIQLYSFQQNRRTGTLGNSAPMALTGAPMALTSLGPQSRFGDKLLKICMVCPQNGTPVLKVCSLCRLSL